MKQKIKICYLITGLETGGAEMMLYRLLKRLNKNEFQPVVVSIMPLGPVANLIIQNNIPVKSLEMKKKYDVLVVYRLYKLLKEIKPDILHTQLFHADILGRIVGSISRVPRIITSIRNTFYGNRLREILLKWTDYMAYCTTTICQAAGHTLIKKNVVPKEKLKVIYNGLNPANYSKATVEFKLKYLEHLGCDINKPTLISIGRLEKQKGHNLLLQSIAFLKNDLGIETNLLIAGKGSLASSLKCLAKELQIDKTTFFLGLRDDISELLSVADVLVLSSLWEGLPGVILEAMSSYLPVVATDVGGVSELIDDGKNGFIIPSGDTKQLAMVLYRMLSLSESERESMGKQGRNIVETKFTLDEMVKSYEELYKRSLART